MTQAFAVVPMCGGQVVNMIMATDADTPPQGFLLVPIDEAQPVDDRWMWSAVDGFYPGPELQAELDAIENEGLGD